MTRRAATPGQINDLPEPRGPGGWRTGKRTTLEAALDVVRDGDAIGLGGVMLYRRPVAAAAELVRRRPTGLRLVDYIGGFEGDILIGAGCIAEVRACYFGLDVLGLAPMHRAATQSGCVALIEETEATIAYGLRAARSGVDFLPARIFAATDMLTARPDLRLVASPYTGVEYVAVPALVPDVAIIHALAVDDAGNAVLGGQYGVDVDLAAAARCTIVTAERVVSTAEIEAAGADILGCWVDHVVEAPRGAWPTSCHPDYGVDLSVLAGYVEACRDGGFDAFVNERILNGTPS